MANFNPKDSLDALVHLSDINRSIHKDRIQREFRFTIKMVSFYLLCVSAKFTGNLFSTSYLLNTKNYFYHVLYWLIYTKIIVIILFVPVFFSWYYLFKSSESNRINQRQAEIAEDEIVKRLGNSYKKKIDDLYGKTKENKNSESNKLHPSRKRWVVEALFITFFATTSVLIIIL